MLCSCWGSLCPSSRMICNFSNCAHSSRLVIFWLNFLCWSEFLAVRKKSASVSTSLISDHTVSTLWAARTFYTCLFQWPGYGHWACAWSGIQYLTASLESQDLLLSIYAACVWFICIWKNWIRPVNCSHLQVINECKAMKMGLGLWLQVAGMFVV